MFNKRLRIVVAVVLALALMLLASPAAYAATEEGVTGSFEIGNATPTVATVELYENIGLTITATEITPLTGYYAKVTVSDANSIDNINEVKLELFYDTTPSDPVAPGSANTQTNAIFTWTKGGDFVMSAMTGTTWTLENVAGASDIPATMTDLSGDWVFAFTAGKVATESAIGNWDMYAKATDAAPATGELYNRDKNILWYGEVAAVTTSINWTTVTPGTGFAEDVNEETDIAITYIANGDYSASVKAANWTGAVGGADAAIYDDDPTTINTDEFSLKADIDATLAGAVQVLKAGTVVDATEGLTIEAGDITITNTLWLKLASAFTADTYTGSITYIIANR